VAKGKEVHFGQLAIVLGYVTPASVAECLKLQKIIALKGNKKQLGEILVEQQLLTEEQFRNILKRQGILRLKCPECEVEYAVEDSNGQWLFKCEKCMGPLVGVVQQKDTTPEPGEEDPLLGRVLGGVRIIARLADGSFSRIYRATEEKKQREVLVRVLKDDFASDPDKAKRFMTRASKAAKVKNGSVAAVYDAKHEEGRYFTVEEMVEGITLGQLLSEEKNLPPRQAVRIALQIAQALKAIHSRKIAHGAVSTANIMISRKGRAVLINLAVGPKLLTSEEAFGKAISTVSPEFTAPEAAKDPTRATPKTDMFSLGAVLYRMLVGAGPFTGETDFEVMLNNLQGKYKKLAQVSPGLPEHVSAMVEKMLQRNPMMRYENMAQVAAEFEKLDASKLSQSKLPVPEDMASPGTAQRPEPADEPAPAAARPAKKAPPVPRKEVPEPVLPDLLPPGGGAPVPAQPEEGEEPLKLARGGSSRTRPAKEQPKTLKPEPLEPIPAEMDEEEPAATGPPVPPRAIPTPVPRGPAQTTQPPEKREAPPQLPEVSAFLVDEPEQVELTEREKEEILEEGLREEAADMLPPEEVLEAMARAAKKKRKPLPIIVAVVVVIVLAIIFILVTSIPGEEKESGETAAQQRYNEALEYAGKNPGKHKEQIEKFRAVMREFPNTYWAGKAKGKVAQLKGDIEKAKIEKRWSETVKKLNESSGDLVAQKEILDNFIKVHPSSPHVEEARRRIASLESERLQKQAAIRLSETRKEVGKLCDEGKFKEALALIKSTFSSALPAEMRTELQRLTSDVYSKARDSFERIKGEVDRLTRGGKYEEAVMLLGNIIADFGIEDFANMARKVRAGILNAQFERDQLLQAAYYGAAQAASDLTSEGKYAAAIAKLEAFVAEYHLGPGEKEKVSKRVRWVQAAQRFLSHAYEQLRASVGKFISLRTAEGILYQGTLKKFKDGMLTIGDLPPLSITEIPHSEIITLARRGSAAGTEAAALEEAAYYYFTGDPEAARDLLEGRASLSEDASGLLAELLRIKRARRVTRHVRLFDTRSLKGWKGDTKGWKVENGLLVGFNGQLGVTEPPKEDYTFSFRLRQSGPGKGIDIIFVAGGGALTWHLGSEDQGFSEVEGALTTRSDTFLIESVWVQVAVTVSSNSAEGRINNKTVWKLEPLPPAPAGKPALGFKVEGGVFDLGGIFLKESR
jgi:serine/threonine-protein kinase